MTHNKRRTLLGALCAWLALSAGPAPGARAAGESTSAREQAYRENNLGVALLEQFRFGDAAEAFERALAKDPSLKLARVNLAIARLYVPDHDAARQVAEAALVDQPDSPQLNYILGLIARGEGRAEDAVPYLKKVLAVDPKDVGANLTLGQVYLQLRDYDKAVACFEVATAAEPYNVSAVYNLGVAMNRSGRREEAQAALQKFQELRDSGYKTSLGQNYLEQGRYAEALPSTGSEGDVVDAATPDVIFTSRDAVPGGTAGATSLTMGDVDGDGRIDAVIAGGDGLRLLRGEEGGFSDGTANSGLSGIPARAALLGDYDNDGKPDLLVLRVGGGVSLLRNAGEGRFEDATKVAEIPPWPHESKVAAFVDVDHDGDLDVLVPGLLLQNDGDGTFTDITERAGLGASAGALALVPTDFDNRRDVDLFVLRGDGPPALLKNLRDGSFRDAAGEIGLAVEGALACVSAGDVNKDGFVDFFLGGERSWLAMSDGKGAFATSPAPDAAAGAESAVLFDYDADGLLDLLVTTAKGLRLLRNVGSSFVDVTSTALSKVSGESSAGGAIGVADLDGDGDQDVLVATKAAVRLLENGGGSNHSFVVDLEGRISNRLGVGAKVEIRAGSLREQTETRAVVPMASPADVVFGLGKREAPDAVRVIWVSGIVQTETDLPEASGRRVAMDVLELDRKPSSCPFLYAWNGERFAFVTDFLGGGEMGYQEAPGVFNHPDPVELVRIAPGQLRPRDGRYELRVTNELEEVLYLDELRLLAVDHPEDVSVFPNEGMTEPPKPARLFAARDPRVPTAHDYRGRDVTDRIARRDRVFADDLPVLKIRGYAREHALTLDLGALPDTHTLLLLTGWTDYAFSSDNVAAHQAGLAMLPPRLDALQADGTWKTVVEQVGIPVGRPQTVVVDLAGLPLGEKRRVRLVTSMRVYWDQIEAAAPADLALRTVALDPTVARLRERGFSKETSPDGKEPWSYEYASVSWVSPWKTMPGRYTREGDVVPLLAAADDRFVISKPGDEVQLSFDATALPPPAPGYARTFLLAGDGFSKEMDINSASPDVVQPLPYHGMEHYPYAGEAPPEVRARWAELDEEGWNTRRVAKPIFPIELAIAGDSAAPNAGDPQP